MTDPHLAEDYHGRYWFRGRGQHWRGSFSAWCPDPECLDMVVLERHEDGWRWHHGDQAGVVVHETWQDAASDAVANAGARPRQ